MCLILLFSDLWPHSGLGRFQVTKSSGIDFFTLSCGRAERAGSLFSVSGTGRRSDVTRSGCKSLDDDPLSLPDSFRARLLFSARSSPHPVRTAGLRPPDHQPRWGGLTRSLPFVTGSEPLTRKHRIPHQLLLSRTAREEARRQNRGSLRLGGEAILASDRGAHRAAGAPAGCRRSSDRRPV